MRAVGSAEGAGRLGGDPPSLLVDGAEVSVDVEDGPPGPRMLLVHGGRASAAWWLPFLPCVRELGFRPVTMELTGHGRSARTRTYALSAWERQVSAAVRALGLTPADVVVAHSLGGAVAVGAAALASPSAPPLIVLDAVPAFRLPQRADVGGSPVAFPTVEAALEQFAGHPRRAGWPVSSRMQVGEAFLHRDHEGWMWGYDPATGSALADAAEQPQPHRAMLIAATESRLPAAPSDPFWRGRPTVAVTGGHDIMIENPADTASAIRRLLG